MTFHTGYHQPDPLQKWMRRVLATGLHFFLSIVLTLHSNLASRLVHGSSFWTDEQLVCSLDTFPWHSLLLCYCGNLIYTIEFQITWNFKFAAATATTSSLQPSLFCYKFRPKRWVRASRDAIKYICVVKNLPWTLHKTDADCIYKWTTFLVKAVWIIIFQACI